MHVRLNVRKVPKEGFSDRDRKEKDWVHNVPMHVREQMFFRLYARSQISSRQPKSVEVIFLNVFNFLAQIRVVALVIAVFMAHTPWETKLVFNRIKKKQSRLASASRVSK